jgi:Fe-S-cluster containining protein
VGVTESRCQGHCCKCFPLSVSLGEIKLSVMNQGSRKFSDDECLLDMLIPLGVMSSEKVFEEYGISLAVEGSEQDTKMRYTCRHLADDGSCSAYESRPNMCRIYPRENKCDWNECQSCLFSVNMKPAVEVKELLECLPSV